MLVESQGKRLLFDVGLRDRYLEHNMECLDIDPESIDAVVVSQTHPDNCRGINGLLSQRSTPVEVVAPAGVFAGKKGMLSSSVGLDDEAREKAVIRDIAGWEEVIPDVWVSPQIEEAGYAESYLVLRGMHLTIVSGRGHAGPGRILDAAKDRFGMEPRNFVGAVFLEKKKKPVAKQYADDFNAHGCTGLHLNHCTGQDGMTMMRTHFGLKGVEEFYVGMSLDFDRSPCASLDIVK